MTTKKEILEEIEGSYDWRGAIKLMDEAILDGSLDPELGSRIIFMLAYFCSDLPHSKAELEQARKKLSEYIEVSDQFRNNAEYLLFSGVAIYLAYFYIGYDDISPAYERLQRAAEIQSANSLYKCVLSVLKNQDTGADTTHSRQLLNEVLSDENNKKWLQSKGLAGKYILGILKT